MAFRFATFLFLIGLFAPSALASVTPQERVRIIRELRPAVATRQIPPIFDKIHELMMRYPSLDLAMVENFIRTEAGPWVYLAAVPVMQIGKCARLPRSEGLREYPFVLQICTGGSAEISNLLEGLRFSAEENVFQLRHNCGLTLSTPVLFTTVVIELADESVIPHLREILFRQVGFRFLGTGFMPGTGYPFVTGDVPRMHLSILNSIVGVVKVWER